MSPQWREGMTLRELVLKAGGLKDSANLLQAEVSRLLSDAVMSTDITKRPEQTVEVINVPLGADFLARDDGFMLLPYDRVAIRRLPWWEMQQTVMIRGEVFFPGQFSLERKDERLSMLVSRAGGLRPDAYLEGARVQRKQDGVGNVAIDLVKALREPGGEYDIILQDGDEVIIPDRMFTVKVVGEVGFPTSLVWEEGKKINWYVNRAGGFLEKADKGKSRVVWPNGMSLPNKGGSKVIAGSTIIVPRKAPPEGRDVWETVLAWRSRQGLPGSCDLLDRVLNPTRFRRQLLENLDVAQLSLFRRMSEARDTYSNVAPTRSPGRQMLNGLSWQYTNIFSIAILQLVVLAILARLLTPEAFGLVGLAMIFVGLVNSFSQLGVGPAIIQFSELTQNHVRAGFTLTVILGRADDHCSMDGGSVNSESRR
ncbi:MAG: oligosaccharide flippase family protein [bacterium]|nr:oligosaccharide flippase family protein [bacterium]